LLRFNSLNQITLWGPTGEIIDYATKQWSGLVSNYYKPRWVLFISHLNDSLATGKPFNKTEFNLDVLNNVEIPFTRSSRIFTRNAPGNSVAVCTRIYRKWKDHFLRLASNYSYDESKLMFCQAKTRRQKLWTCTPPVFANSNITIPDSNTNKSHKLIRHKWND